VVVVVGAAVVVVVGTVLVVEATGTSGDVVGGGATVVEGAGGTVNGTAVALTVGARGPQAPRTTRTSAEATRRSSTGEVKHAGS
jgi:hypothetical protein